MNYRVAAKGLLEVEDKTLFIEYADNRRTYYAPPLYMEGYRWLSESDSLAVTYYPRRKDLFRFQ